MAVAPKITPEVLKKRRSLDERQKELEREARAIAKEKSAIDADLKTALEKAGKTSLARGGFRVSLVAGRPSVSWKGEFIKVATAQVAAEIEANAPRPPRLEVTEDAGSRR